MMTAHGNYYQFANKAAELEREGSWSAAMECWDMARALARKNVNEAWAQTRVEFCSIRLQRTE